MKLLDLKLKLVIENPRGSYKKFADTLEEYPVLGVTFPTDYGYIDGYISEDSHDLDVFVGSGDIHGILRVNRDDVPGGIETKIILFVTGDEFVEIKKAYEPVIEELRKIDEQDLVEYLKKFLDTRNEKH